MLYLKQSTATSIVIGPFLDDTDGKTPETALVVASMDADLYKHSDAHPLTKIDLTLTASGGNNDCAHVANGFYSLELTVSNTDTLGRLYLTINIAGALPVWHEFNVISQEAYDLQYGGTLLLRLEKATKLLVNKAIQTKGTGEIEYFDDDGETVILTHTPTDDESIITRTPS